MIRIRLYILFSGFLAVFLLILARSFQLQLLPHDRVESLARRQGSVSVELEGRRGNIYDREGRVLALSLNSYSLFVNPRVIENPKTAARQLGRLLGVSSETLLAKFGRSDDSRRFAWVQRKIPEDRAEKLRLGFLKTNPAFALLPEFRRDYPNGKLASHLLGFLSVDGVGLEGIERFHDKRLRGSKHTISFRKDAKGRFLIAKSDLEKLETDHGEDLHLTLDASLQYAVERGLEETVRESQADGGTVIVLDPNNGEILALANAPTFNPNDLSNYPSSFRRNRAVTDPIEPGSVVKPFLVARALEDNIVNARTQISGGDGTIRVGNKTISEAEERHAMKSMSIVDLIRLSSNVGTVRLGQMMGFDRVQDTFLKMGFNRLTGVDLPGESRGLFPKLVNNQKLEQATMAFGQGFAVTPLQMATAFSILANGGLRIRPHLVIDSRTQRPDQPAPAPERLFTEATMKQMRHILTQVVESEGTGVKARIEMFPVAGKTGTAQKVDFKKGGYERGAYWASFAGILPADRPQFVIYVLIDRPRAGNFYGGTVAAPLFAKIARVAVRKLHSPAPTKMNWVARKPSARKAPAVVAAEPDRMPDFSNEPLARALHFLSARRQKIEFEGEGYTVQAQIPAPGTALESQNVIYLKLR